MKGKNYWKYIIIGLILFVVLFHVGAIFYLMTQQTYEITSVDYYDKGQAYEQEIQAMNRGYLFQWDIKFSNEGQVTVTITSNEDLDFAQDLQQLSMSCMRPNDSRLDKDLLLPRVEGTNTFSVIHGLKSGRWDLRVSFIGNEGAVLYKKQVAL